MSIEKMNIKVLYAEDDEDVREILSSILAQRVQEVIVAKDGEEALELFHQHDDIDVIVTDIEMPRKTGLELIRDVKSEINYPYIVITTAFNDTDFLLEAIELRINKFLFKPIRAQQLFTILEEINETLILRKENIKKEKLLSQYQNAIDKSAIVYITDIDGKISYVNSQFCEVMGYKDDEVANKNIDIIKSPLEDKYDYIKQTVSNKNIWQGILSNTNQNGETIITETTICPIINVDDTLKELITISHDITEKVRQNRELQKLHTKIRQDEIKKVSDIKDFEILKLVPFPSCIVDNHHIIIGTNSEFIELFDYISMKEIREKLNENTININELFDDVPVELTDNFSNFLDDLIADDDTIIIQKDNSAKFVIKTKSINNKIIVSLCKQNG